MTRILVLQPHAFSEPAIAGAATGAFAAGEASSSEQPAKANMASKTVQRWQTRMTLLHRKKSG